MRTHRTSRFASAALIALLTAPPAFCRAQTRELDVEKILNPMPEYDPFEKSVAAPQFFPDAVDKRARELLIDTLTNRNQALSEHLNFLKNEDARLQKEQRAATGLTDRAQDLVNNTIQDREQNLAAYREALRSASSPERKKYLESVINRDDHFQAEQLMRQSSTNFWGGMVNRLLSSVDLIGVASGNYVGAAAETAISQLYALLDRDMPMEERRALARDLDHLKRYPDDPKNAEVRKQVEALDKKKRDVLVAKQLAKAKEAANKDDDERALFHAQVALLFDPRSEDAEKLREQIAQRLTQRDAARQQSLKARAEENLSPQQQADAKKLLEALSVRDANLIQRVAIDTEKKYPGKPLADASRDAEAVALEMKGWHEAARKAVEQNAQKAATAVTKERADILLHSPDYNLLSRFNDARTERQLESAKYVLLGDNFLRKNLMFAAGAMVAGPSGLATIGMANALMISRNLFQVMTNNPISAQPVIDAGVAYVRSHPKSENASEVYRVLADAYEERGMVERALTFHELAGSPKEKIAALNDKAAQNLLNAATKTTSRSNQQEYLKAILDFHPDSGAAAEATKKLAALAKDENQGMRMSKQFLLEHPEIWGPRGLGLKATLFDGDPRNMEIADRGAILLDDNELLVFYQTPWGVRSQSHRLTKSTADRFFVALREQNQQVAAADANQRAKDSVGGIKNVPTAIVRGERERRSPASEDRDDTTFTLIRDAGGSSSYRRVLDAELITENERNPGSQYHLPPIQGSISASRFSMTGALPTGFAGSQLSVGSDRGAPYGGVQIPIPLLQGFVPVDFMVQGRPGGVSVFPHIRTGVDRGSDPELYR